MAKEKTRICIGDTFISTVLYPEIVCRFLQRCGMEKDAPLNHSREQRSPSMATLEVPFLPLVLQGMLGLAYFNVGFVLGGLKALGKQMESERDEGFVMGVKPA
jgi:hypothetical protein